MDSIQLASNDTLIQIIQHQREQNKMIKNMFTSLLVAIVLVVAMCVGGALYFLNTFEVQATQSTTTTTQEVSGENSKINNVEGNQFNDSSTNSDSN